MSDGCHPARYPQHADPEKGQMHGGECNRTPCDARNATWFNIETFGFYCKRDAMGINEFPMRGRGPLCVELDHKPTVDEMNEMRQQFYGYQPEDTTNE